MAPARGGRDLKLDLKTGVERSGKGRCLHEKSLCCFEHLAFDIGSLRFGGEALELLFAGEILAFFGDVIELVKLFLLGLRVGRNFLASNNPDIWLSHQRAVAIAVDACMRIGLNQFER